MKKYKNPILLQSHVDLAKSPEAKEQLRQLEIEYQEKRAEQEEILHAQDKNFYQGLKDGLHVPSQEQAYLDYKDDRRLRLRDKFLSEGDKTLEQYQPEIYEQIREQEQRDHHQEVSMAKNLNNGYYLEKHDPKLAQALRENIGDITHREESTRDFVKGQELRIEERKTEFKENTTDIAQEQEQDLTIETDNEPDLDVGNNNTNIDDISPDKGISFDIDD